MSLKQQEKQLQAFQEVQENLAEVAQLQVELIYYLHDRNAEARHRLRALQQRANWDVVRLLY